MNQQYIYCPHCGKCYPAVQPHCILCNTVNPLRIQSRHTYNDASPAPYTVSRKVPGRGLGIVSTVMGILSLLLLTVYIASMGVATTFFQLSHDFGIAGIVLGAISTSKSSQADARNGFATAGLISSIMAVSVCLILGIIDLVMFSMGMYYYSPYPYR